MRCIIVIFVFVLMLGVLNVANPAYAVAWPPPPPPRPAGTTQPSPIHPQLRELGSGGVDPRMIEAMLPDMSTGAADIISRQLGLTRIGGKKLDYSPSAGLDRYILADARDLELEPSAAFNPVNEQVVVVVHSRLRSGHRDCMAEVSFNGGDSFDWNDSALLPLVDPVNDSCTHPMVRFSPDGQYAYYLYMSVHLDSTGDILLAKAPGSDPLSIALVPQAVFSGAGSALIDNPWMDTVILDSTGHNDGTVYAAATYRDASSRDTAILFNSSQDYGVTWNYSNKGLYLTTKFNSTIRLMDGARPVGNPYQTDFVTVCWYDSGADGVRTGLFNIYCWSNDNRGAVGYDYFFTAVRNQGYELDEYLDPSRTWHRWWTGMFPSLAVDETGLIYMAYTVDPTPSRTDGKAGLVMLARGYEREGNGGWQTPLKVTTGATAQGFPTVSARCNSAAALPVCSCYIAYFNHSNSILGFNSLYDIWFRRAVRPPLTASVGSLKFDKAVRINDATSLSAQHPYLLGDYIGSFVNSRRYLVTWTDRSDVRSTADQDTDILYDILVP